MLGDLQKRIYEPRGGATHNRVRKQDANTEKKESLGQKVFGKSCLCEDFSYCSKIIRLITKSLKNMRGKERHYFFYFSVCNRSFGTQSL